VAASWLPWLLTVASGSKGGDATSSHALYFASFLFSAYVGHGDVLGSADTVPDQRGCNNKYKCDMQQ
jgi:hypothetical protein